jgi:hypothetical protein
MNRKTGGENKGMEDGQDKTCPDETKQTKQQLHGAEEESARTAEKKNSGQIDSRNSQNWFFLDCVLLFLVYFL